MDQLSSCYFCGDALDASLTEHPVVPESLHPGPDAQQTIVLCGTCKRKLDAVMEAVAEAVPEDATAADSGGSAADIESTLGDDEDVLRSVGDGDTDVERAAEASGMQWGDPDGDAADVADEDDTVDEDEGGAEDEGSGSAESDDGDDEKERKYTSSRRAGYSRAADDSAAKRWNTTGRSDDEEESGADAEAEAESEQAEQSATNNDDRTGDRSGGQGGQSAADGGNQRDDDADRPDVSLTRLENTKVMRLLQNREFPVEREDFVTVASSAYEVSPQDCDKVIDLAIDHDLLREEDGQLHPGGQWG